MQKLKHSCLDIDFRINMFLKDPDLPTDQRFETYNFHYLVNSTVDGYVALMAELQTTGKET